MAQEASEPSIDAASLAARVETLSAELAALRDHVERIEKQGRELDEFISLLAHDLRTPLTSIRGYSQLMLRGRKGAAEPAIASGLQTVIDQSDRLAALTNLLLDISRVRLDRVALRRVPVDLGATVRAVLASRKGRVAPAAADLPDRGPMVSADSSRIDQVVRSLIEFASTRIGAEEEGAGGARFEVSLSIEGDMAVLAVTDDAPALGPRETAHLFDQLVRPASTATGFELARPDFYILQGIVSAHGGRATAESPAPGCDRGAKLTVWLPLHTENDA